MQIYFNNLKLFLKNSGDTILLIFSSATFLPVSLPSCTMKISFSEGQPYVPPSPRACNTLVKNISLAAICVCVMLLRDWRAPLYGASIINLC